MDFSEIEIMKTKLKEIGNDKKCPMALIARKLIVNYLQNKKF